ncbi:SAM-dependent methyltransferase [Endobacter medicaginis]|uniref:SAM-dependent methyltransferase n=3 Tax=Endobacter medicaginis TaxID=1181271 RepID=A0A839V0T0_9PROT|nr:methyltransferase domain-containing protein [Endobacter medicaginis]MBB3174154.1 SAM-dependent methyltransferase [Endobacter medicaginis]MCX5474198.1 hypothetical protein [Endobacter medicaginis]
MFDALPKRLMARRQARPQVGRQAAEPGPGVRARLNTFSAGLFAIARRGVVAGTRGARHLRPPAWPEREAPPDLVELGRFYGTARGAEVARQLSATMRRLVGEFGRGSLVAGLGYPGPFLRCWPQARRIDASLMPVPTERIDPADLVIVVHALEFSDDPRSVLREAWKLLADHGRLVVVVPNRGGPLAHLPSTPFGRGRAMGISELDRLLADNLFRTETRRLAVALPSARPRLSAIGDPLFGGVIVAVAVKDVYAGLPLIRAGARIPRRVMATA